LLFRNMPNFCYTNGKQNKYWQQDLTCYVRRLDRRVKFIDCPHKPIGLEHILVYRFSWSPTAHAVIVKNNALVFDPRKLSTKLARQDFAKGKPLYSMYFQDNDYSLRGV